MIIGLGTDIVEIARVEKLIADSDRLAKRILRPLELQEYEDSKQKARYLAKKFAAKEALAKAMGTGIGRGTSWQHFEISHDENGKPRAQLVDAASNWSEQHAVSNVHLSISDEQHYATATVIIEGKV